MPIEVNEIAIQLKVRDGAEAGTAQLAPASAGESLTPQQRDSIVADCVARVLRALDARRER